MKRTLGALAVLAALAGCSSLQISTDYDKSADFSQYRTFSYRDSGEIKDPLWAKRIEGVLSDALEAKGLKRMESGGDVWLTPHARLSKETQINTYNTGWGYGWGWYGGMGMSTSTVSEIPVGTLIVDLVDGKKKELVWRGTATDTLQTHAAPEEREKNLRAVAAQLFANYPPAKK